MASKQGFGCWQGRHSSPLSQACRNQTVTQHHSQRGSLQSEAWEAYSEVLSRSLTSHREFLKNNHHLSSVSSSVAFRESATPENILLIFPADFQQDESLSISPSVSTRCVSVCPSACPDSAVGSFPPDASGRMENAVTLEHDPPQTGGGLPRGNKTVGTFSS